MVTGLMFLKIHSVLLKKDECHSHSISVSFTSEFKYLLYALVRNIFQASALVILLESIRKANYYLKKKNPI